MVPLSFSFSFALVAAEPEQMVGSGGRAGGSPPFSPLLRWLLSQANCGLLDGWFAPGAFLLRPLQSQDG